jgi:Spy/CpxP family protein refolding chaperone
MTRTFTTAAYGLAALVLGAAALPASAQNYGPGPGNMMGGNHGWGMGWGTGWGMGGFGAIGFLAIALIFLGFVVVTMRNRKS